LNKSQAGISAILPDVPTAVIQAAITGAGSAFVATLSNTVKREVLAAIVTSIISRTYILVITAGAYRVELGDKEGEVVYGCWCCCLEWEELKII
jgi:hypothetical protein